MEIDTGIDMKELMGLVSVARFRSFSRAAEELHLAQPTGSAHVANWERKIGRPLIARTKRNSCLLMQCTP